MAIVITIKQLGPVSDRARCVLIPRRARSETGPSCSHSTRSVGDRPELLLGFKLTEAA